jgi:HEPN domain-containing protein
MNESHVEAQRWLRQAQADLAVVRTLHAAGHHAAACFYSQQAAEKALKAVVFAHGARVVLGHSVRELARQCEAYDTTFAGVAEGAALLDQFYITTRYPMAYLHRLCLVKRSRMLKHKPPRSLPNISSVSWQHTSAPLRISQGDTLGSSLPERYNVYGSLFGNGWPHVSSAQGRLRR